MREMMTIRETVERCKTDGLPVSEYALRLWIKQGEIPVRHAGTKALLFYPNVIGYLRCDCGGDIAG